MGFSGFRWQLLFLALWALSVPAALCQMDQNHEIGKAAQASFGQAIQQNIGKEQESNFYKFQVDRSGIVRIKVDDVPAEMVPKIVLWNKNAGDYIGVAEASNPGDALTLDKDLLGPGWHYFQVFDKAGKAYSSPYTLTASFEPAPDPFEPNNGFGDATGIELGQTFNAYICPKDDSDFYQSDINTSGVLTIKVQDVPEEMVPKIVLWNKNAGDYIGVAEASNPGDALTLEKDLLGPGRHYFQVFDKAGKAYSKPYTLTVGFEAAPDPYEPNNGFGDATEVQLDQPVNAYICPKDDSDFYKLIINSPGVLALKATDVPEDMVPKIVLWNKNGGDYLSVAEASNPGDSVSLEKGVSDLGLYYFQVFDKVGKAYSGPYTLMASMKSS